MRLKNCAATIRFDLPNEVSLEDLATFISDALSSWGGGLHPDDPLFDSLDIKQVRIGHRVFITDTTETK